MGPELVVVLLLLGPESVMLLQLLLPLLLEQLLPEVTVGPILMERLRRLAEPAWKL